MANEKINVTVVADVSKLKNDVSRQLGVISPKVSFVGVENEIAKIQQKLKHIEPSIRITSKSLTAGWSKAKKTLEQKPLPVYLKATNASLGVLRKQVETYLSANPVRINLLLKGGTTQIKQAATAAKNLGGGATVAAAGMQKLNKSVQETTYGMKQFVAQNALAVRRFSTFLIPTTALFGVFRVLRFGTDAVLDFDRSMRKLTQIMDNNRDKARDVAEQTMNMARAYGFSAKEALSVASTLAQAGEKFSDTQKLMTAIGAVSKTSLLATFGDMDSTAEGLIATLNQFNLSASESPRIMAIFNSMAKNMAVESRDLTEAVRRGGSTFAAFGGTLEDYAAIIASIRSRTRMSADTIGTLMNTLNIKAHDFSGVLAKIRKEFDADIMNADGSDIKSTLSLFRELADVFDSLDSKMDRSKFVKLLGGVRGGKIAIPLLEAISAGDVDEALGYVKTAPGEMLADLETAQDSIQVSLGKVGSAWYKAFAELGESKFIKETIRNVSSLVENLSSLVGVLAKVGNIAPRTLGLMTLGAVGSAIKPALGYGKDFFSSMGKKDPLGSTYEKQAVVLNNNTSAVSAQTAATQQLIAVMTGKSASSQAAVASTRMQSNVSAKTNFVHPMMMGGTHKQRDALRRNIAEQDAKDNSIIDIDREILRNKAISSRDKSYFRRASARLRHISVMDRIKTEYEASPRSELLKKRDHLIATQAGLQRKQQLMKGKVSAAKTQFNAMPNQTTASVLNELKKESARLGAISAGVKRSLSNVNNELSQIETAYKARRLVEHKKFRSEITRINEVRDFDKETHLRMAPNLARRATSPYMPISPEEEFGWRRGGVVAKRGGGVWIDNKGKFHYPKSTGGSTGSKTYLGLMGAKYKGGIKNLGRNALGFAKTPMGVAMIGGMIADAGSAALEPMYREQKSLAGFKNRGVSYANRGVRAGQGALSGAATGAMLGNFVLPGGLGIAIGGLLGGAVGGIYGDYKEKKNQEAKLKQLAVLSDLKEKVKITKQIRENSKYENWSWQEKLGERLKGSGDPSTIPLRGLFGLVGLSLGGSLGEDELQDREYRDFYFKTDEGKEVQKSYKDILRKSLVNVTPEQFKRYGSKGGTFAIQKIEEYLKGQGMSPEEIKNIVEEILKQPDLGKGRTGYGGIGHTASLMVRKNEKERSKNAEIFSELNKDFKDLSSITTQIISNFGILSSVFNAVSTSIQNTAGLINLAGKEISFSKTDFSAMTNDSLYQKVMARDEMLRKSGENFSTSKDISTYYSGLERSVRETGGMGSSYVLGKIKDSEVLTHFGLRLKDEIAQGKSLSGIDDMTESKYLRSLGNYIMDKVKSVGTEDGATQEEAISFVDKTLSDEHKGLLSVIKSYSEIIQQDIDINRAFLSERANATKQKKELMEYLMTIPESSIRTRAEIDAGYGAGINTTIRSHKAIYDLRAGITKSSGIESRHDFASLLSEREGLIQKIVDIRKKGGLVNVDEVKEADAASVRVSEINANIDKYIAGLQGQTDKIRESHAVIKEFNRNIIATYSSFQDRKNSEKRRMAYDFKTHIGGLQGIVGSSKTIQDIIKDPAKMKKMVDWAKGIGIGSSKRGVKIEDALITGGQLTFEGIDIKQLMDLVKAAITAENFGQEDKFYNSLKSESIFADSIVKDQDELNSLISELTKKNLDIVTSVEKSLEEGNRIANKNLDNFERVIKEISRGSSVESVGTTNNISMNINASMTPADKQNIIKGILPDTLKHIAGELSKSVAGQSAEEVKINQNLARTLGNVAQRIKEGKI